MRQPKNTPLLTNKPSSSGVAKSNLNQPLTSWFHAFVTATKILSQRNPVWHLPRKPWTLLIFLTTLASIAFIIIWHFLPDPQSGYSSDRKTDQPPKTLKQTDQKTNFLLMGISGGNRDGANLTDTLMVISVHTVLDNSSPPPPITLISLPRDIYLESLQNKINAAYSLGKETGLGLDLPKKIVSEITGLPIHYAIVVDFVVFEKIIDQLGGIDINVPRSFTDTEYPIAGKENAVCPNDPTFSCRYQTIHFDAGWQHMNGERALQFVRSRKSHDDEGNDFARNLRQQLVLEAVRNKIFSLPNMLNLSSGIQIYRDLQNHIDTDFDFPSPDLLLKLAMKYRQAKFTNIVLNENQLFNPPEDHRGWILLPIGGNWDNIRQFIATKSAQLQ